MAKTTLYVAALGLLVPWHAAWAGKVTGSVTLPRGGVKDAPESPPGFVKRKKNPFATVASYDPRSECIVVLEGGPVEDDAKKRRDVTLELTRTRFVPAVLPVVAGSSVTIKNTSKKTHPVSVAGRGELWGGDPIGAGGDREEKVGAAYQVIHLSSAEAPHLDGVIVPLPTNYFAVLDAKGDFELDNVPSGKWTVRVWYRDGWLSTTRSVDVGSRGAKVSISLPVHLKTEAPKGK